MVKQYWSTALAIAIVVGLVYMVASQKADSQVEFEAPAKVERVKTEKLMVDLARTLDIASAETKRSQLEREQVKDQVMSLSADVAKLTSEALTQEKVEQLVAQGVDFAIKEFKQSALLTSRQIEERDQRLSALSTRLDSLAAKCDEDACRCNTTASEKQPTLPEPKAEQAPELTRELRWFTAEWCIPCKAWGVGPERARIEADGFQVVPIDVDTGLDAGAPRPPQIPYYELHIGGKFARHQGTLSFDRLKAMERAVLKALDEPGPPTTQFGTPQRGVLFPRLQW